MSGILLYGPPGITDPIFCFSPFNNFVLLKNYFVTVGFAGCGKTLIASAVAKECGLNFVSVKVFPLLFSFVHYSILIHDIFSG